MSKDSDVAKRFDDEHRVDEMVKKAVRRALAENKKLKNPIAVWEDGQVKIIQPEDIPDSEEAEFHFHDEP